MSSPQLDRMISARCGLLLDNPFFGALALGLKLREDNTNSTAWVDGVSLGFNAQWVATLTNDNLKALWAHEVMHCFPADTQILTDVGLKRIADMQQGDRVFDGTGQFTEVVAPMSRKHKGQIVTINSACGMEFSATPEHPVLCLRLKNTKHGMGIPWRIAREKNPEKRVEFVPAGEIDPKTDVLAFRLPTVKEQKRKRMIAKRIRHKYQYKKIALDPETAYFLGWWVGDGGLAKACGDGDWFGKTQEQRIVTLTLSLKDPAEKLCELIERRFYRATHVQELKEKARRIQFSSTTMSRYLRNNFTDGNGVKVIPSWMLSMPKPIIGAFIDGLREADGSVVKSGGKDISNTSRSVIGMASLLLMRLGYLPGVTLSRKASGNNKAGYKVYWTEKTTRRDRGMVRGNVWFTPINWLTKRPYDDMVYNIETKSHTYSLPFVTVHNCANGHPWRRDHREPFKWNIACDKAINTTLKEAGQATSNSRGFTLPPGVIYAEGPEIGQSSEWIYARLPDPPQGKGGGQSDHGQSTGQGEVRDAPTKPEPGDEEGATVPTEADWQQRTKQAALAAKAMGKLPASMARFADLVGESRVDWKSALRRFIQQMAKADYTWSRPSGRYLGLGLYMPSLESHECGHIGIAIDTSGSIDNVALGIAKAEIEAVMEEVNPASIMVYYADAEVANVDRFEQGEPLEFRPKGGGGTDFRPVFEACEKAEEPIVCLIYVTDMFGTFPESSEVPTIWLTDTADVEAPFGEMLRVS